MTAIKHQHIGIVSLDIVTGPVIATSYAVAVCVAAWASSNQGGTTVIDRIMFMFLLVAPAVVLAILRSTFLIDHFMVVVVTNRLIRRLLDWGQNQYDTQPILSLATMILALLMVPVIVSRWKDASPTARRGAVMVAIGLGYGLVVGIGNGAAAIYALGGYATPFVVLYFAIACRPTPRILQRWMLLLIVLGALAAVYGIAQWTLVPPWDAKWVMWSRMYMSMGHPKPYVWSIASTLESRGPAAMFFAVVAAVAIGIPDFRKSIGIPIALLSLFALLLTQARAGLVYLTLTLVTAAILQFRRGGLGLAVVILVLGFIAWRGLSLIPGSKMVIDRTATLGSIEQDRSLSGRLGIASRGIATVTAHPLGFGLGSAQNASRADQGVSVQAIGDNGYLELLSTLGAIGTTLLLAGMVTILRPAFTAFRGSNAHLPATAIGRAMLISLVPAMMVENQLTGFLPVYIWVLLSVRLSTQSSDLARVPGAERRVVPARLAANGRRG